MPKEKNKQNPGQEETKDSELMKEVAKELLRELGKDPEAALDSMELIGLTLARKRDDSEEDQDKDESAEEDKPKEDKPGNDKPKDQDEEEEETE